MCGGVPKAEGFERQDSSDGKGRPPACAKGNSQEVMKLPPLATTKGTDRRQRDIGGTGEYRLPRIYAAARSSLPKQKIRNEPISAANTLKTNRMFLASEPKFRLREAPTRSRLTFDFFLQW
jgi:hypothetical protein